MDEQTRLYGLTHAELTETLGSGDEALFDETLLRWGAQVAAAEKTLTSGAVTEALRRWVFDPPQQVGQGAPGLALVSAFEVLCAEAARQAGVPRRLTGPVGVPSVGLLADEVDALDVDFDFERVESRLRSRKTCGVVFQTDDVSVGYLTYQELRRLRAALRPVDREVLGELAFLRHLARAVRLAVRYEVDLVAITS